MAVRQPGRLHGADTSHVSIREKVFLAVRTAGAKALGQKHVQEQQRSLLSPWSQIVESLIGHWKAGFYSLMRWEAIRGR